MNILIDLESIVEETHSPEAGGNHELPFDLLGLDLGSSLEENDGFFKHVLFGIVHTKARDDIDV